LKAPGDVVGEDAELLRFGRGKDLAAVVVLGGLAVVRE
jgi:hypothetical protein